MKAIVDPDIERYAEAHTAEPPELLERLARETQERMKSPQMLTGRLEGQLLRLLVLMLGAKRVLEVGMFTGYSALMMASALPEDGELHTCEIDPEAQAFARRYFDESPHGKKIHIHPGPALETLDELQGPFDFAFIDADKQSYPRYYEKVIEMLRPGGVVAIDNVLWSGEVLAPSDEESRAIHALNGLVQADPRVDHVLATIRDGLLLARKRGG
jgi:caffeoyl-CoA O-methyltransferase